VRIYNRALTAREIQESYRSSQYYLAFHTGPKTDCDQDPGACMDYGLVGYWNMDEGSGQTAYDGSQVGVNDGTLHGPKWTTGVRPLSGAARGGGGLSFDGVDDFVRVPNSPSVNVTGDITVEKWVRLDFALATYGTTVHKEFQYTFTIRGDRFVSWADSSLWNYAVFGYFDIGLQLGVWHHIVVTKSGSTVRIYRDGAERVVRTGFGGALTSTTNDVSIGAYHFTSRFLNGLIDEVRIYNRALSPAEIRYHYNRGGPVAHWKFDEGTAQTAFDESPNNNDGRLGTTTGVDAADPIWVEGKFGSALSFDGINDFVEAIVPQTKTTYSLWVQNAGIWEHVVRVGEINYVNGIKGATPTSFPIHVSGNIVQIGKTGAVTFFNGLIDDVRIYNYARTAEQILQDYNAGLATYFR